MPYHVHGEVAVQVRGLVLNLLYTIFTNVPHTEVNKPLNRLNGVVFRNGNKAHLPCHAASPLACPINTLPHIQKPPVQSGQITVHTINLSIMNIYNAVVNQ